MRAATGMRYDRETIQAAAKQLHDWLKNDSALRSFLAYLAGAGCYWSGYAHERAIRSFVTSAGGTKEDIAEAAAARSMSSGEGSASNPMSALESLR